MISLRKIELFHALYFVSIALLLTYIWGTLDFVFYSYKRWGSYELHLLEHFAYLYFILSPIVLAHHVQTGVAARINPKNRYDKTKGKIIRVARFIYLLSVELAMLVSSTAVVVALLREDDLWQAFLEPGVVSIFAAGLIGMATSIVVLILTVKLR